MDELMARAIHSINKTLKSFPWWFPDDITTQMNDIRGLLIRLSKSDLSVNYRTRLFYQQLKRLMDYNDTLKHQFWFEIRNDILYLLEVGHDEQSISSSWNRFIKRMNFEETLDQRRLQYQQMHKEQKSLSDLFHDYQSFFEEYLQKCLSLHSKVQMQSLIENPDDFLGKVLKLPEASSSLNSREHLKEKLKYLTIPLDFSNRSLNSLGYKFFQVNDTYTSINNDPSNFLPSQQADVTSIGKSEMIKNILALNRWIVILGDPGSAKTTLLRWITRIFSEAASRGRETVDSEECYDLPVRIPILIRISEFAQWFAQNQTKGLIDYIGNHTWFSERYCDDKDSSVLKELIYHGHALILLDGLDEIIEVGQRVTIVDLVERFVDEYIRAPDLISAFDDVMFDSKMIWKDQKLFETQPPSKPGGNQLVVTSRIVGYQFRPLNGPSFHHYSLLLMDHKEANEFIKTWMKQVIESIENIVLNERIKLDEQMLKSWSKRIYDAGQAIFENSSGLLNSNPLLLSLICRFIFQSSLEFHPKSRIEVYEHAVQAVLRAWNTQESSIKGDVLINFLVDLATYLHLQSSSGLIDAFDIDHLCFLSLKRQQITNDRTKLREYTQKIISLLESNTIIVIERGLQIFGFLHLSFQEYFVAQGLVKGSSVEDIAASIRSFTINPRFHESLCLAIGWISWKWSLDKYDKFCSLLFTLTDNQLIPFGILLFFDTISDLYRLPSNAIIFLALNNLLNHRFNGIRKTYLISNLSKLPDDIIIEWMQLYLKDEKCLVEFCQIFLAEHKKHDEIIGNVEKPISPVIYQQLWLFHHRSSTVEFVIDQILQRKMISVDLPDQIFNKDLSLYFMSHNLSISNINPLLLSVIIAICGGICLKSGKKMINIDFSLKRMHRESSVIPLILKYFDNNEESHVVKVHTLITQYESIIQQSLPSNTSVDIVDTFIALICLQGFSQPLIYQKYYAYQALPLALNRLKRTWFYLIKSCPSLPFEIDFSSIRSEIASIIKVFSMQYNQFKEQLISFPVACESAWKKHAKWDVTFSLNLSFDRHDQDDKYSNFSLQSTDIMHNKKADLIAQYISCLQILQQNQHFVISFLPQSLQQLYYYTTISPMNKNDSLPFVVFLSDCLTNLEEVNKNYANDCFALLVLQPLFKEHMFESYASLLFLEKYFNIKRFDEDSREILEAMKDRHLFDSFLSSQSNSWEILIDMKRQRISQAENVTQNQERDIQIFTASISLARLFQAQHRTQNYQEINKNRLISDESQEIQSAVTNIVDPVLRIIAWSTILDMKDPLIFDGEQRNQLRWEMISLLQNLLPDLSLLKATLLFIHCHSSWPIFPTNFQCMASLVIKKFNETPTDSQCREQEIAYIALQQLNNPDLSNCLLEFIKRKNNLAELVQLNSNTFHQYFMEATSFNSLNGTLLASLYLIELVFNAQALNLYSLSTDKINISRLTELKDLWNDSSKDEKIMTFPVASWITNYLDTSVNTEDIDQIIEDVSCCSIIESKALSVMEKWLSYRTNEYLRFFTHYAALQLAAEGFSIEGLVDIIEEMFLIDRNFGLESAIERALISPLTSLTIIRQILISLQQNVYYSVRISLLVERKEILELVLSLEKQRVTQNVCQLPASSTKPFLLRIKSCSEDLQLYLIEHLQHCIVNMCDKVKDNVEIEYIAVVVKWITERMIHSQTKIKFSTELYNYIFKLFFDQRLPNVQKVIITGLSSVFLDRGDRSGRAILGLQMELMDSMTECSLSTREAQMETIDSITDFNLNTRRIEIEPIGSMTEYNLNTRRVLGWKKYFDRGVTL